MRLGPHLQEIIHFDHDRVVGVGYMGSSLEYARLLKVLMTSACFSIVATGDTANIVI